MRLVLAHPIFALSTPTTESRPTALLSRSCVAVDALRRHPVFVEQFGADLGDLMLNRPGFCGGRLVKEGHHLKPVWQLASSIVPQLLLEGYTRWVQGAAGG